MRRPASFFFASVFACAASIGSVSEGRAAGDTIWSALVHATNETSPEETPTELRRIEEKLENVFGYNQFRLLGEHAEQMDDPKEYWLIPSRIFSLRVASKMADKIGYRLKLELYHEKRRITEFEANLGAQSAIFIRGPLYAGGQLIIVLMVK